MESWTVLITWTFKLSVPQKQNCLQIGWKNESCDCTSTFYLYFRICNPLYIITLSEQSLLWWIRMSGFDINGCPIARGKWNASSGKWKRHPTCPIGQVKMILWYVQFLKSKMINIELFSVGSCGEFYLNIALYISCILCHFVLFCWLRNSPFSNKDRVIYISQSSMSN